MKLIKTAAIILSNLIFISAPAQQQGATMQTNSFGEITNLKDAKFNRVIEEMGVDGMNNAGSDRIPYSRITGSPFWKDDWQQAYLYKNNKLLGVLPAKLNFGTNEIYIIRNEEELAVNEGDVTSIIFRNEKDSSAAKAVFTGYVPNLFLNNKKLDDFVQVLNEGNRQLLKYTNRYVVAGDSLFHTLKRYYFSDRVYYFLKSSDKVEKIKKLNKDNLLVLLPSSSSFSAWIEANNIDFKREADVITFLNYYNAKPQ